MKKVLIWLFLCYISFFSITVSNASFGGIFSNTSKIDYCPLDNQGNPTCGLEEGIEVLKNIDDIQTKVPASEYIQNIVTYLLSFLALVAVILIIYAGFLILTSSWDDDKIWKWKKIIIYALLGILVIFLAYSIVKWFLSVL